MDVSVKRNSVFTGWNNWPLGQIFRRIQNNNIGRCCVHKFVPQDLAPTFSREVSRKLPAGDGLHHQRLARTKRHKGRGLSMLLRIGAISLVQEAARDTTGRTVIWAFIPTLEPIFPFNSPRKVCSVTTFLVRAALSRILAVFLRSMSDPENSSHL
jgi:hypothetical protein